MHSKSRTRGERLAPSSDATRMLVRADIARKFKQERVRSCFSEDLSLHLPHFPLQTVLVSLVIIFHISHLV